MHGMGRFYCRYENRQTSGKVHSGESKNRNERGQQTRHGQGFLLEGRVAGELEFRESTARRAGEEPREL